MTWSIGSLGAAWTTIRIFLLDDHEIVRTGLRSLLESEDDLVVVGEAGDRRRGPRPDPAHSAPTWRSSTSGSPTAAVSMSAARSGRDQPEIACLMLTSYADDEALFAAVMAGASGYVLKQVGGNSLVDDVRRVAAGESLLDPALVERVVRATAGRSPEEDPLLAGLTPQERRILDLVAEGQTNRQIAADMFLAEKTVKNYVSNLLAKLGMERRTQAATYATRIAERAARDHRTDAIGHLKAAGPGGRSVQVARFVAVADRVSVDGAVRGWAVVDSEVTGPGERLP